jgi:hypothetical protein
MGACERVLTGPEQCSLVPVSATDSKDTLAVQMILVRALPSDLSIVDAGTGLAHRPLA